MSLAVLYNFFLILSQLFTNHLYFSGAGGATYCAVASLRLMGFIEDDLLSKNMSSSIINMQLLLDWSLQVCFLNFLDGMHIKARNKAVWFEKLSK